MFRAINASVAPSPEARGVVALGKSGAISVIGLPNRDRNRLLSAIFGFPGVVVLLLFATVALLASVDCWADLRSSDNVFLATKSNASCRE